MEKRCWVILWIRMVCVFDAVTGLGRRKLVGIWKLRLLNIKPKKHVLIRKDIILNLYYNINFIIFNFYYNINFFKFLNFYK